MPSPYCGCRSPVFSIREFWMTPSAEDRRKCTPSSPMSRTCTPSIVTCGDASIMMPFGTSATVKPVSRHHGAPYNQKP
jgi:hypothetical protein